MPQEWQDEKFVGWYNEYLEFEEQQIDDFLIQLKLTSEDTLVDFGCGNGVLLQKASNQVKHALGIDISEAQLKEATQKLEGINNISLQENAFLKCDLSDHTFTKGTARKSLHHLEDDEKIKFFQRISPHFSPNALFLIEDAVFTFPKTELETKREMLLQEAEEFYGNRWEGIQEPFKETIFDECATDIFNWEKALEAGGFRIKEKTHRTSFYGIILATKEP